MYNFKFKFRPLYTSIWDRNITMPMQAQRVFTSLSVLSLWSYGPGKKTCACWWQGNGWLACIGRCAPFSVQAIPTWPQARGGSEFLNDGSLSWRRQLSASPLRIWLLSRPHNRMERYANSWDYVDGTVHETYASSTLLWIAIRSLWEKFINPYSRTPIQKCRSFQICFIFLVALETFLIQKLSRRYSFFWLHPVIAPSTSNILT